MHDSPGEFPKTTMHVRNAVRGDADSLSWVVQHLAPLLLTHADYRLGPTLRPHVDAQDLVNEAWVATLPKLGQLSPRDGRLTPVLLKYLTTTMKFRIGRLLRTRLIQGQAPQATNPPLEEIPAKLSEVSASMQRSEMHTKVLELLSVLGPRDREIIILRGIEQHPSKAVAEMLDISSGLVDKRYSRALQRLRRDLPESVFEELLDE